jgi:hypothetical protein
MERDGTVAHRLVHPQGGPAGVKRREVRSEGLPPTQAFDLAKKRQPGRHVGVGEPRQEEPPEETGQYAHG